VSDDLHEVVDMFRLTADESATVDDVDDVVEKQVTAVGEPEATAVESPSGSGPKTLSPEDL